MRYYKIELTPGSGGGSSRTFDSSDNPNALDMEMDVFIAPFATPVGGSYVKVWGVSLADIGSASDFNGFNIAVSGGMKKGLPLANPAQSGLLFQGMVLQAFGNWIDTDQNINFYPVAGGKLNPDGTIATHNVSFDWKKNTPMSDAIKTTLSTAYPDKKININISPELKVNYDAPGVYSNLTQFAQTVKETSKRVMGGDDYAGVDIVIKKDTINVYDGTVQSKPVSIAFADLIGQPTWIESPTIQIKTVMRADLSVGDYITMPKGIYTTTEQAQSFAIDDKTAFQGSFQISSIRHLGHFRQADASSWVTIIEANPTKIESPKNSAGSQDSILGAK